MKIDSADGAPQPHILVLGDLMLDRYTYGIADRISPEAPILVVKTLSREVRLGGAANVAANCRALDALVTVIGVVGNDHDGATIRRLFQECGAEAQLATDDACCTTVKERILGQSPHRTPQQIVRIDTESTMLPPACEDALLAAVEKTIDRVHLILISDYRKGVCTPRLLQSVLAIARERQVPVLVDPGMHADWSIYRGAALVKPNRREAAASSGMDVFSDSDAAAAASLLSKRFEIPTVVVTLDQDGMLVHQSGLNASLFRGSPREVSDVTGAGDTVFAVFGVALARGMTLESAVRNAIIAAGLQVEKQGATTVTWQEILNRQKLERGQPKVVSQEWIATHCITLRQRGQRVAFTNGCFDLLHAGHVACLREAKSHGDMLVVGLNSDSSVRRLKGPSRPVNDESSRASVLAALECVDFVVVFEQDTPGELIESVRPDVLIKGGDYSPEQVVGAKFVQSYGGRVVVTNLLPDVSTTAILTKHARSTAT